MSCKWIASVIVLSFFVAGCGGSAAEPLPLVAEVGFDTLDVVVANRGGVPWTKVRLSLNFNDTSDGYYLDVDEIRAGERYQKASALFANADGQRFNPYAMKPQTFRIRTADGEWIHIFKY